MANVKITELTAATALAGTDVLPIVDVGADATKKVSVSDLLRNLPDGTASAPALAFADDQNTGVLSPGNNSLAFATSGTQRLVIDSSGNVGINKTSPANPLHVRGTSQLLCEDSATSNFFQLRTTGGEAQINAYLSTTAAMPIVFKQYTSERLRIDSSGNLGVGDSSPSEKLSVAGKIAFIGTESAFGNSSQPTIYRSGSSAGSYPFDNFGHLIIQPRADGAPRDIVFATGNTGSNKTVIDSSGQVGIGTSSPSALLTVDGGTKSFATSGITIKRTGILTGSSDFILAGTSGSEALSVRVNGSEQMRIDSSGRVGIKTSSMGSLYAGGDDLVIGDGGASNQGMTLYTGSSQQGIIAFADGFTGAAQQYAGYLLYDHSTDSFRVATTGQERLRIDSSGRVGIGSTSPSGTLQLQSSTTKIVLTPNGTDKAVIHDSNRGDLILAADEDNTNGASSITFKVDGSDRARIDSSGRLLVGTTSSRAQAGINFPVFAEGTAFTGFGAVYNANNTTGAFLALSKSRGTSVGSNTIVQSGDQIGEIFFSAADGTDLETRAATIAAFVDGTPGSNDMPGRLVFSTCSDGASSPTERMRIANTGKFSTHSTAYGIEAGVTASAGTTTAIMTGTNSATVINGGNVCYRVWSNGNVQNTNNSYGAISDAKLKENIVDASSQWNDIKDIRVRNYNFIEGQTHTQLGVVAQEVETVSPGLVTESPDLDDDGNDLGTVTKSVNYSVLYMKAVKALQEAMDRIETLEAKVAALEAQ